MDDAKRQRDCMDNPRTFLALFPTGPRNGRFIDPYLALVEIDGIGISSFPRDLLHETQATWADEKD